MLTVTLLICGAWPARAADDWADFIELRKQIGDETFRDHPAQAIEQLQEFYQSRKLDPDVAAEVVLQVAQITDVQLKQPDEALKILDAAMDDARAAHDPNKPVEVMYLEGKTAWLIRQKQPTEAIALLKANRQMIVDAARNTGDTHLQMFASRVLNHWADALDTEGAAPQESIALLENALNEMPVFLNPQAQMSLNWQPAWMYERLALKLTQAKQFDRALQWGKLFWAESTFDKASLDRATKTLNQVWGAQDKLDAVLAFTRAQIAPPAGEPKAGEVAPANPLSAVELPTFEATSPVRDDLKQLREVQRNGPWRGRVAPIITLEIALQEWAPAMKRGQELLLSDVTALDGPQQIARVFKAKDASVARANQFLAYLEGKAPNPLPGFFDEIGATQTN